MPQASEELREQMRVRFGDSINDYGPAKFLEDAGYKMNRGWEWTPKPGVTDLKGMTRDEFDCLLFLCHEWDYGGLAAA
ncbi:hypothetical protein [Mesorhizobium sp.]|uniref:hypothetical protein n=1 Tax=Mesorhizobium sp. TaxID=1871066 RepID=UPI0012096F03|nr:hypothetical protein [Mesorhizobium sp.]TIL38499.1 MAG: hypothetical protein E5Y82_13420 [Mesorhizobium sp.]